MLLRRGSGLGNQFDRERLAVLQRRTGICPVRRLDGSFTIGRGERGFQRRNAPQQHADAPGTQDCSSQTLGRLETGVSRVQLESKPRRLSKIRLGLPAKSGIQQRRYQVPSHAVGCLSAHPGKFFAFQRLRPGQAISLSHSPARTTCWGYAYRAGSSLCYHCPRSSWTGLLWWFAAVALMVIRLRALSCPALPRDHQRKPEPFRTMLCAWQRCPPTCEAVYCGTRRMMASAHDRIAARRSNQNLL